MIQNAVIGLDLSLTATGIASPAGVFEVRTKPTDGTLEERFDTILTAIAVEVQNTLDSGILDNWYLQDHLNKPELEQPWDRIRVVIEGPAFGARGNALYQVWGLQAIVRHWLTTAEELPFMLVAPNTLKKYATGSGRANKKDMVRAARERWGYEGSSDNEADAIALREYGREHWKS